MGGRALAKQDHEGWLILRGEYIPGPCTVEIVGDEVQVNGLSTKRPPKDWGKVDVDPKYGLHYRIAQEFWDRFKIWAKEYDKKGAAEKAFEFWKSRPEVEDVELDTKDYATVSFRWKGEASKEGVLLEYNEPPTAAQLAEMRAQTLADLKNRLEYTLGNKGLAFVQGEGQVLFLDYPESKTAFETITQICRGTESRDEKIVILRENVGCSTEMAIEIIGKFKD